MISYFARQEIPADFAAEPRLVANIIAGRVEYLLGRVVADGLNPLTGTLTIQPFVGVPNMNDELRFTWTPLE